MPQVVLVEKDYTGKEVNPGTVETDSSIRRELQQANQQILQLQMKVRKLKEEKKMLSSES